jgi:uracil-DNA glycosylase
MGKMNKIETSLQEDLKLLKPVLKELKTKVLNLREEGHIIFPRQDQILRCLDNISFEEMKVVILAQDPYPTPGNANGLAFSVEQNIEIPASLKNIFKEISSDIGITEPIHGDLSSWASQGVLLLNRILTVEQGRPLSHSKLGWEEFTTNIIKIINKYCNNLVFLLWGTNAKQVIPYIDKNKHLILTAAHPSPLSATRGFFGCKHFSKTNIYLQEHGKSPIDWSIK